MFYRQAKAATARAGSIAPSAESEDLEDSAATPLVGHSSTDVDNEETAHSGLLVPALSYTGRGYPPTPVRLYGTNCEWPIWGDGSH